MGRSWGAVECGVVLECEVANVEFGEFDVEWDEVKVEFEGRRVGEEDREEPPRGEVLPEGLRREETIECGLEEGGVVMDRFGGG